MLKNKFIEVLFGLAMLCLILAFLIGEFSHLLLFLREPQYLVEWLRMAYVGIFFQVRWGVLCGAGFILTAFQKRRVAEPARFYLKYLFAALVPFWVCAILAIFIDIESSQAGENSPMLFLVRSLLLASGSFPAFIAILLELQRIELEEERSS